MKVGIIGATGYGGADLLRLLWQHPEAEEIITYTSSKQDLHIHESYPHLTAMYEQKLEELDAQKIASEVDIVFLATPPGVSSELTALLAQYGAQVIDLSGDLRLEDPDTYTAWYKRPSASSNLLNQAVYGLSEWNQAQIKEADIIANPGCYPTAILLGLAPLIKEGLIDPNSIIIDAKSGTSGAGRTPSLMTHFSEMNENFKAYQVNTHKHIPEIEQVLKSWNDKAGAITFQPHLVPMVRGIMATMYGVSIKPTSEAELRGLYEETYKESRFVRIRPAGSYPATKEVYGSNFCDIGIGYDERTNRITVISVIDNVVKGASGQAIQNWNIMNGWDEATGLNVVPTYP
ncbi:N-acetyl-gamma-glutamyl-phosphate reductase [Alkalihalophilus marmarensis]|uniref:N-acetyl-gamma-glutamyl-phosphate reductase n=1 Tax=Alkalihalophilus marmarensis DSM 21297 TaxID=1188261 RepID=U6SPW7_9BACI|nr:N-acetyl-gamma-glutamyl-phosphate reductase [Alkalihalophilus marmarensis]ERN52696.1 N-acetyl-gamma-glutamyl-phosphate reductase [Alkalihalophilus marmarensis DSM 21297]MCM3488079.1 N-acetyl-gamma-glutamyl-phosphate reductase [Alkalihalophilus marmarensis]